ncbi:ABC transporter substrate-binding protein [Roseovarius pelagicus]|uniref:ABC transporter substrate-binding protein n=1 Tax=Roseovarius pelagicus TaxID=2980108 RepID=A0ABY6D5T1_9RHOB|nr:ABC transporter substrate-binding protein [Roseovarius pelagicus]UXX81501.1 ABC transporter substrate-binding protein [Roseovarius pelagicus]
MTTNRILKTGPSRRGFIAGTAAVGAGLMLPAGAFGQTAPKKGGTLRVGLSKGSSSDSMDPATFNNDFMFATGYAVFNTLTEIAPDGTAKPNLAESYEASADAATWTFRLREDADFSDGKKVTAEDVISSIRHHMGEDSKSGIKPLLAQITGIRADGDKVVIFELEGGNADFPFVFNDYHLGIRQSTGDGIDPHSLIGTGGFTIETFEPGVRVELKRRDDYWKKGYAHFDKVEILKVGDVAARMNALMNGEVDVIDRPDYKTIDLLGRNPNVQVVTHDSPVHYIMPMHTDTAPYDDVNVRQALKYGIDREQMVQSVLYGYGSVGNDQPIASTMLYYNDDLEQIAYDPERAKHHLSKAGLSSLDVTLSTADTAFNGAVDTSVLFKESAKAANININVDRQPDDGYFSNVWLKKPFCGSYWGGRPTADLMFTAAYAEGADWNETKWKNERFNVLLLQARPELNHERRAEMYGEMQKIVKEDGGALIPAFGNAVWAMSKNIAMPEQLSEMWGFDSWRFIERWWTA